MSSTDQDNSSSEDGAAGRIGHAYELVRDRATQAQESAEARVEQNPLALLLGGIALGAVVGALLPSSRREAEALGPLGQRLQDAAREAARAAREAGRDKLDELGLNGDSARQAVQRLLDDAVAAAQTAGTAAFEAARTSATEHR